MKLLLFIFFTSTFSVSASPQVFDLSDLIEKIRSGVSATDYCNEKAALSVKQAKKSNAPLEAQKSIQDWVSIACSLDVKNKLDAISKEQV